MSRMAREVVEGLPHHSTQRGNNRQDVFFVDDDHLDCLVCAKSCTIVFTNLRGPYAKAARRPKPNSTD